MTSDKAFQAITFIASQQKLIKLNFFPVFVANFVGWKVWVLYCAVVTFFQFEVVCANVIMFQCRTFPLKTFASWRRRLLRRSSHQFHSRIPSRLAACKLQSIALSRLPTGRVNFAQSKFYQQTFRREAKLNCKRHQAMLADVTSQQRCAARHVRCVMCESNESGWHAGSDVFCWFFRVIKHTTELQKQWKSIKLLPSAATWDCKRQKLMRKYSSSYVPDNDDQLESNSNCFQLSLAHSQFGCWWKSNFLDAWLPNGHLPLRTISIATLLHRNSIWAPIQMFSARGFVYGR